MTEETFKIEGLKGLEEALREMPDKLAKGALRSAVRAGANAILQEVRMRTPIGSGSSKGGVRRHLRDDFGISTRFQGLTASASIRPRKFAYLVNWLERTGAKPHREPKRGKGHLRLRGGQIVASVEHPGFRPKPFVVPAFEASWRRAVDAFSEKLGKVIERIKARG